MSRAFVAVLLLAAPAFARTPANGKFDPTGKTRVDINPMDMAVEPPSDSTGRRVTPLFAPIPFKNTQVGWGGLLMVGLIHHFDSDPTVKPSTGAVAGFYTENKSWGVMAMEMARIQRDTWRLRGLGSHVDINYDFFGIGEEAGDKGKAIPIAQSMNFAVGSVLRRVTPGIYAGASVLWINASVKLGNNSTVVPPPSLADRTSANLLAPGVQGELDTRDDDYWPTHGSIASLKGNFFSSALGSAREFQRYTGTWSWYTNTRLPRTIVATNLNLGAAMGDVPFWALPTIGGGAYGLRGYTQGRYRDHIMTTAQAEVRWHAANRFGAAAFGGFGQVAPEISKLTDAQALWAGGAGVRFQLTKEYPMHLRLDLAWGRTERLLYFSIGEAI